MKKFKVGQSVEALASTVFSPLDLETKGVDGSAILSGYITGSCEGKRRACLVTPRS